MKIAVSKILELPTFFDEISDKKLHIQTLYKIFKLKKRVEEAIAFYQESLQRIILDCAILDEQGCPQRNEQQDVFIDTEHIDEFTERMDQLTGHLIEFPETCFNLSEFDNVQLTLRHQKPFPL